MKHRSEQNFLKDINENINIIFKISNMYCTNNTDIEDLKQEMLFHLWKSYGSFQGKSKFSTWMYRVCLNTAMTFLKKSKSSRYEPLEKNTELEVEKSSLTFPAESDKTVLLNRAIKKLTDINKAILLLYFEEVSYEDIAQIIGFSKSNISVRLVRIKKELEKELVKYKKEYYGYE